MYENQTFENILQRMLNQVPDNIDKREGSIIYNALVPYAIELAQIYVELDINSNISFADTASGDYLTRRCAEFGVNRKQATKAQRKLLFYNASSALMDVPIGSRYGLDDTTYIVTNKISTGQFMAECEQYGTIGNQLFGSLLPITYINGLSSAQLSDVLIPASDLETDESLKNRYYTTINQPAFGGNISDYKQKIVLIDGVADVKVYDAWDGGGTVKCVIIDSQYGEPTTELIDEVQEIIDPLEIDGTGKGIAPIAHEVIVEGVSGVDIDIETTLTLASGYTVEQVQEQIEELIENYLLTLRKSWANQSQLIVRINQIESAIISNLSGIIIDTIDTTINENTSNLVLEENEIPVLGTVTLNES